MSNAENPLARCREKSRADEKYRSMFCAAVMWLTLLVIGALAVPACLLILLIEGLWTFADSLIRRIEG